MIFAYSRSMGQTNPSTDALVEILTLCEQTLTALNSDPGGQMATRQTDKAGRLRNGTRTNIAPRLVLIQGGLSITTSSTTSR
jgi:hypothetical protein